jgi:hypothetical protein
MVDRSFVGQDTKSKPFTPVSVAYQKKAMALLAKYVFAPNAFDADAPLYPYLQQQRRGFGFFGQPEDIKPQIMVQGMQVNILSHLLSANNLSRINNSSLYGNTYSVADVLNDLTNAIFRADLTSNVSLFRANMQTEFVKGMAAIVNTPTGPYDNTSRAVMYSTLRKVKVLLGSAVSSNEQTRAHRLNLLFLIDKAIAIK